MIFFRSCLDLVDYCVGVHSLQAAFIPLSILSVFWMHFQYFALSCIYDIILLCQISKFSVLSNFCQYLQSDFSKDTGKISILGGYGCKIGCLLGGGTTTQSSHAGHAIMVYGHYILILLKLKFKSNLSTWSDYPHYT